MSAVAERKQLEIYYLRHADREGTGSGDRPPCDNDLSALGHAQGRALTARFAGMRFDAVLTSPMVRCVQTCGYALAACRERPPVELCPALIEKGTPAGYLGQSVEYLSRYCRGVIPCPDAVYGGPGQYFESDTKALCLDRAAALNDYLRRRFHCGERVLLCSHGTLGNSILQTAVGLRRERDTGFIFSLYYTSVSKYGFSEDGRERIFYVNDVSHLRELMGSMQDKM